MCKVLELIQRKSPLDPFPADVENDAEVELQKKKQSLHVATLHLDCLRLNVKKNEIWWPSRRSPDPFPADVDRIDDAGVKLLGAPIGTKAFTTDFVQRSRMRWTLCTNC